MKRLRKVLQVLLVGIAILLVAVDPASACRLLGNRRCCCECPQTSCTTPVGSAEPTTEANEPSPSDVPRAATSDSGLRLPPPLGIDAAAVEAVRSTSSSAKPQDADTLTFGEASSPTLSPTRSQSPVIVEPTVTPTATANTARQPANIDSRPAANVASPVDTAATAPIESPPIDLPMPMPQVLRPRQQPSAAPSTASAGGSQPNSAVGPVEVEPALPVASNRPGETPATVPLAPSATNPRTPAAPGSTSPRAPVTTPAFPAVADDPFAPVTQPRPQQPADDDPFAPLPPAAQPQPKPAAPLAAEPTRLKIAESLVPGADGRLPVREWNDNSGSFHVRAQLILILDGKVRLLKETGRTTTVPMERLSATDQSYIADVIARYGRDLTKLDQLAAR